MYRWLQAYLQQRANNSQDKVDDFGIRIPLQVVLKLDKVEMSPIQYEKTDKENAEGDTDVKIPELCTKCYHLDEVNKICKANMSFEEAAANEECSLFYDKGRVGGMGFSASENNDEQIKQTNAIDYDEVQQKIIDEITQIGKAKQCKHRDNNRTFLKNPLKSYKYSSQACIEHFLTCERDYLKKKTSPKKGEKEQATLFEAAKKLCSFIRRRRFGSDDSNSYIVKKAEVNKYDGTVEAIDAVDLFLASVMKTFKKLPKDLLTKWSEWCSHYRIDTEIEDEGMRDIKKRIRNSIYKNDNTISHVAQTAWKIAKDKYKINEDEVQRRINEIHKYERVIKRSLSQQEAERMFKRMFDGKIWEDVKAPINFKLL